MLNAKPHRKRAKDGFALGSALQVRADDTHAAQRLAFIRRAAMLIETKNASRG
jgi:hypothetical protein